MPEDYKNEIFEEKMAELIKNLEVISFKNIFSRAKFGRYIDTVSWGEHMVLVLRHYS